MLERHGFEKARERRRQIGRDGVRNENDNLLMQLRPRGHQLGEVRVQRAEPEADRFGRMLDIDGGHGVSFEARAGCEISRQRREVAGEKHGGLAA